MKWIETKEKEPPRDMTPFLADVGYPWPVITAWNGCDDGCWVHAMVNVGMFDGEYVDTYFETESFEVEFKQWMPLPEIQKPPIMTVFELQTKVNPHKKRVVSCLCDSKN